MVNKLDVANSIVFDSRILFKEVVGSVFELVVDTLTELGIKTLGRV